MRSKGLLARSGVPSLFADYRRSFPTDLEQMLRRFDEPDGIGVTDWSPAVDIEETDAEFVVKADVPGVDPEKILVSVDDGALVISGERKSEKTEEGKDFKRSECFEGSFYRRFVLPDTADADGIKAKGVNGVLTVTIPKVPAKQARQIKVAS